MRMSLLPSLLFAAVSAGCGVSRLSQSEKLLITSVCVPQGVSAGEPLRVGLNDPRTFEAWKLVSIVFPRAVLVMLAWTPFATIGEVRREEELRPVINAVRQHAPQDLGVTLSRAFADHLRRNAFFGRRLGSNHDAAASIHVEISRWGLAMLPGGDRHTPVLEGIAQLVDRENNILLRRQVTADGYGLTPVHCSTAHATLGDYATDPGLLDRHLRRVTERLAKELAEQFRDAAL